MKRSLDHVVAADDYSRPDGKLIMCPYCGWEFASWMRGGAEEMLRVVPNHKSANLFTSRKMPCPTSSLPWDDADALTETLKAFE